jgi:hypothetical protein
MEVVKTMDPATRSKLIDSFDQEQRQRRLQTKMKTSMQHKFGTIHQLIEAGHVADAEAEWATIIPEDEPFLSDEHSTHSDTSEE